MSPLVAQHTDTALAILALITLVWRSVFAVFGTAAFVGERLRRRSDRALDDVFASYGIAYRAVSPPSHAAGRTV